MFNKIAKIIFILFLIAGVIYLALPGFSFPAPPTDSIQSQEPADLESSLRRGYFTNYSRQQVMDWYKRQFDHLNFFGFNVKLPTPLLNYPPEYAQTLIRDQTSSSFLQELVHPFRESEFINGFEPETVSDRPTFTENGKSYRLKIIVKYEPSNKWVREAVFLVTAGSVALIYNAFRALFVRKNK